LGLLDSTSEHPPSRIRRYIITTIIFVGLLVGGVWWLLRFHAEKVTVKHFLDTVEAGNMQEAYRIWKPLPSYTFKDFMEDWGPDGYYGPVKSSHFEDAERPKGGSSGVIIVCEVSPFSPFPDANDGVKQARTKEVRIWVEFKDQSMSFPP
jgi:hypothetical protein